MKITIINTLPHAATIRLGNRVLEFPACPTPFRLPRESKDVGGGFLFNCSFTGEELELAPPPKVGVVYLTSQMACMEMWKYGRFDFVFPHLQDSKSPTSSCNGLGVADGKEAFLDSLEEVEWLPEEETWNNWMTAAWEEFCQEQDEEDLDTSDFHSRENLLSIESDFNSHYWKTRGMLVEISPYQPYGSPWWQGSEEAKDPQNYRIGFLDGSVIEEFRDTDGDAPRPTKEEVDKLFSDFKEVLESQNRKEEKK